MVDNIKLNKLNLDITTGKIEEKSKKMSLSTPAKEGVVVTNHFSKLVSLLSTDQSSSEDTGRVLEIKQRIQNNQYQVDVEALAMKLIDNGIVGYRGT